MDRTLPSQLIVTVGRPNGSLIAIVVSDHLKDELDDYIASTPVIQDIVKVVRLPERQGLVGARTAGAKAATSQVICWFFDGLSWKINFKYV